MSYILITIMLASLSFMPLSPEPADHNLEAWQNLVELQGFLADDIPTIVLQADENGNIQIVDQCEDLAIGLCERARKAGRLIETEILIQSEVIKYYPADYRPQAPHCICKAFIGNEVYFIEPSNDMVWLAYYLD